MEIILGFLFYLITLFIILFVVLRFVDYYNKKVKKIEAHQYDYYEDRDTDD